MNPDPVSASESSARLAGEPRALSEELIAACDLPSVLVALLDHCDQAVKLVDLDGRVLAWNPACERLYGWPAEEVVGGVLLFHPEPVRRTIVQSLREIAAAGVAHRQVVEATRKDGSTIGVDLTLFPVNDSAGDVCGVLSLASLASEDSRFSGMTDEFLMAVAHEITALLTALQGAAQLMLTPEVVEDPTRRERVARLVADRCRQIGDLTEDLLMSSGFLDGGMPLDIEVLDVTALATEAAARHSAKGRASGVRVIPEPRIPHISGDRARIVQAISTMLAVGLDDAAGPLTLSVYDDGASVVLRTLRMTGDRISDGAPDPVGRGHARHGIGTRTRLKLVERIAAAHGGTFSAHRPDDAPGSMCLRLPHRVEGAQS